VIKEKINPEIPLLTFSVKYLKLTALSLVGLSFCLLIFSLGQIIKSLAQEEINS
jgi:hypothetical protein